LRIAPPRPDRTPTVAKSPQLPKLWDGSTGKPFQCMYSNVDFIVDVVTSFHQSTISKVASPVDRLASDHAISDRTTIKRTCLKDSNLRSTNGRDMHVPKRQMVCGPLLFDRPVGDCPSLPRGVILSCQRLATSDESRLSVRTLQATTSPAILQKKLDKRDVAKLPMNFSKRTLESDGVGLARLCGV